LWWQGSREKQRKEPGTSYILQGNVPRDLLPPFRLHLLTSVNSWMD
jgi:hypothetical protein